MSVSTRTRFEILKRDGFRCRYCGATAVGSVLHVDHVVPIAEGGSDDPANLIAACADCNLGKSSVPLEEARLAAASTPELLREHAEQVREYLVAARALADAQDQVRDFYASEWRERVGNDPPVSLYRAFKTLAQRHTAEALIGAIDAVAEGSWKLRNAAAESRYFYGALRLRSGS